LIDNGEDKITAKLFMNDSKEENLISSSFFLPFKLDSSIIVAGNGQSCNLKTFICKPFIKINGSSINENRNCDCCSIY
jgi:hypothetical protein